MYCAVKINIMRITFESEANPLSILIARSLVAQRAWVEGEGGGGWAVGLRSGSSKATKVQRRSKDSVR